LAWLGDQADSDLFIASLTVAEVRRGVLEKSAGKKRTLLETWFSGPKDRRPCSPAASCLSTRKPVWFGRG
jgi:hypothetical protein